MGKQKKIVIAAGGVIWRETNGVKTIAVIHRKKYDDWSLPKGKQKPSEPIVETAIREVKEETGFWVDVGGFAGTVAYEIDKGQKLVFFWNMKWKDGEFVPGKEVDKLEWVSLDESIERIKYPEERSLLEMLKERPSSGQSLPTRLGRLFVLGRYTRIHGTLESYRQELEGKLACSGAGQSLTCYLSTALAMVREAERFLERNQIDEAWKSFFAAQRAEVPSLSEKELEIKATVLRREAEKLSSWRKGTIEDLLGTPNQPRGDRSAAHIYEAMLIRDEHNSNLAYKDRITRIHFTLIAALLFAILATMTILTSTRFLVFKGGLNYPKAVQVSKTDSVQAIASRQEPVKADTISLKIAREQPVEMDWRLLVNVALFGLLGGTFSAALKLPGGARDSRIPELVGANRVTLMRVLIGAASAVVVLVLLNSSGAKGLFDAVFGQADLRELSLPIVYFFGFAAGFTERFVLKAVELVAKEKK